MQANVARERASVAAKGLRLAEVIVCHEFLPAGQRRRSEFGRNAGVLRCGRAPRRWRYWMTMLLPAPPSRMSSPRPPTRTSSPSPPRSVSAPSLPTSTSLPVAAVGDELYAAQAGRFDDVVATKAVDDDPVVGCLEVRDQMSWPRPEMTTAPLTLRTRITSSPLVASMVTVSAAPSPPLPPTVPARLIAHLRDVGAAQVVDENVVGAAGRR